MKSRKNTKCIYCEENLGLTRDHIPPKELFPNPRPSNLITVPCCERCRSEQSLDDEYFITIVANSGRSQYHPAANKLWNDKILVKIIREYLMLNNLGNFILIIN